MGSTRLPGKVLAHLGGETVLARVARRLSRANLVHQVVIATSMQAADLAIVKECDRLQLPCFRGAESDVLDRYYAASHEFHADVIVRVTSDCPLIDPQIVDRTISVFQGATADYASNVVRRTYPRGLDVEVFTRQALERAWSEAREAYQREHVTPYFNEHPERFRIASDSWDEDYSQFRWTLDTYEDLKLIRTIYSRFDNRDDFGWQKALALMIREPWLAELNCHIVQKEVHA